MKIISIPTSDEDTKKLDYAYIVFGNIQCTIENSFAVINITKIQIPCNPLIAPLGIYCSEIKTC